MMAARDYSFISEWQKFVRVGPYERGPERQADAKGFKE